MSRRADVKSSGGSEKKKDNVIIGNCSHVKIILLPFPFYFLWPNFLFVLTQPAV